MALKLTFVNVGYGEAMLIRQPETGFTAVVDAGGAEPSEYADNASGRVRMAEYLESIGLTHIDLMIATHVHEDHISGMPPVARKYPPKTFWHTLGADFAASALRPLDPALARNPSERKFIAALNDYRTLCADLADHGCMMRTVSAGDRATLCPGLDCAVLAPEAERMAALGERLRAAMTLPDGPELMDRLSGIDAALNNYSIILRLDLPGARILLPGDTNRLGYGGIDPQDLRADIFKVGHHGQQDGASPELFDVVQPRFVVCCASSDRRYNSAHPALMDAIRQKGAALCFSDCPDVAGVDIPPHRALTFDIRDDGGIEWAYVR